MYRNIWSSKTEKAIGGLQAAVEYSELSGTAVCESERAEYLYMKTSETVQTVLTEISSAGGMYLRKRISGNVQELITGESIIAYVPTLILSGRHIRKIKTAADLYPYPGLGWAEALRYRLYEDPAVRKADFSGLAKRKTVTLNFVNGNCGCGEYFIKGLVDAACSVIPGGDTPLRTEIRLKAVTDTDLSPGTYISVSSAPVPLSWFRCCFQKSELPADSFAPLGQREYLREIRNALRRLSEATENNFTEEGLSFCREAEMLNIRLKSAYRGKSERLHMREPTQTRVISTEMPLNLQKNVWRSTDMGKLKNDFTGLYEALEDDAQMDNFSRARFSFLYPRRQTRNLPDNDNYFLKPLTDILSRRCGGLSEMILETLPEDTQEPILKITLD